MYSSARGRDRDTKNKKKRSASASSGQRSREREMRRRKQQQQYVAKFRVHEGDAAAKKEGNALMPTPQPGQRMYWDGFQWLPRTDTTVSANDPTASKKMRRLYLTNLPTDMTETMFSKQLYQTMQARGFCNDPNVNPVLHTYFTRGKGDDHGFCELATVEETDRALQLDGMLVMNSAISIKRPADAQSNGGGAQQGGQLSLANTPAQAVSAIIQIAGILNVDARTSKEDYDDVVEDMNEGCGAHGKIKNVFIVRSEHSASKPELKAGDVFLQCGGIDDATKIMRAMGHRKYDGRQIQMTSFEDAQWYSLIKPLL